MPVSEAPITVVGSTSTDNGAGALTLVLSVPGGVVDRQFMLATMAVAGGTGTVVVPPVGWVLLSRADQSTNVSLVTFQRTATALEPATYTFTLAPSVAASGGIIVYNNVEVATPVEGHAENSITPINVTQTTGSTTTTINNSEVVAIWGIASTTALTTVFGVTEQNHAGTANRFLIADAIQVGAGGTGTETATATAATFGASTIIALAPLFIYSELMTGGAVTGGSGIVTSKYSFKMTGGAVCGGTSVNSSSSNLVMTGGAICGGPAIVGLVHITSFPSVQNDTRLKFFQVVKFGDIDPQAVIQHGVGTYITRIEDGTVTATAVGGTHLIDGHVNNFQTQLGVTIGDRITNINSGFSGTVLAISGNELTIAGPTFQVGDMYTIVGDGFVPRIIYFQPIDAPATLDGVPGYVQAAERFKYYKQQPTIGLVDSTNLILNFSTQVGSGSPVAQFDLVIETPHLVTD